MIERFILWKPPYFDWSEKHRIVWVSVAALDASWRQDCCYVPPGATGSDGNAWRYGRFGRWLQTSNPRRRVKMLDVGYLPAGRALRHPYELLPPRVVFGDGRHRFAWCRDHGVTALPVMVYLDVADIVAAQFGTSERKSVAFLPTAEASKVPSELEAA